MKNDDIKAVLSEIVKTVEILAESTANLVNDGTDDAPLRGSEPGSLARRGEILYHAARLREVFEKKLGSAD